jgi:hypothetical protein
MNITKTHIKIGLLLLAITLLCACTPKDDRVYIEQRYECKQADKERIDFTLSCIANANPMSDEEPEDWIRQCNIVAKENYCKLAPYLVTERQYSFGDLFHEVSAKKVNP